MFLRARAASSFFLMAALLWGQDLPLERLKALERDLASERARNEQQAERIKELELTVISILAQKDHAPPSADAVELERLVDQRVKQGFDRFVPRSPASPFRFSGRGRFVARIFSEEAISTDRSFEVEHLVLQVDIALQDDIKLRFTPGASHQGALFLLEAYAAWSATPWLEVRAGRFLVPFSGTHAWAFPSDSFIEPYVVENSPRPFLYAPWWDEGIMVSGRVSFGEDDRHQISYAAYVLNGFDEAGLDGVHKRNIGDNNENKTLGGRISVTLSLGDDLTLSLGAAGLRGKYDSFDDLAFWAVEADLELAYGPFSLYFEIFHLPREIRAPVAENPAFRLLDVSRTTGIKLRPRVRVTDSLSFFVQADWLQVRQLPRSQGLFSVTSLEDEAFAVRTFIVGARIDLAAQLVLELEAGIFDRDQDLGKDIRFLSASFLFWF